MESNHRSLLQRQRCYHYNKKEFENWWVHSDSNRDPKVKSLVVYPVDLWTQKMAGGVGAAPTKLSFGDSVVQMLAPRLFKIYF